MVHGSRTRNPNKVLTLEFMCIHEDVFVCVCMCDVCVFVCAFECMCL